MKAEYIPGEEWRDIDGYEGLYQVSNLGRVKSLSRYARMKGRSAREVKEKILSQANVNGYRGVILSINGNKKTFRVHRLVAQAFIPNPHNLPYINHKDEVRSNNNVSNLEWCTPLYNNMYGTAMERKREKLKHCNHSRSARKVAQYSLDGKLIQVYSSIAEAKKKTGARHIASVCCGKANHRTAGGYIWRHVDREEVEEVIPTFKGMDIEYIRNTFSDEAKEFASKNADSVSVDSIERAFYLGELNALNKLVIDSPRNCQHRKK